MTVPVDYLAVIADLQAKREAIDKCIQCLLSMSTNAPVGPEPVNEVEPRLEKYLPEKRARLARSTFQPTLDPEDDFPEITKKPEMGTREAVLQAVNESPRTGPEIADRVGELAPSIARASVSAMIHYLMRDETLRKDDQLKLHLVKNGKIQGV